MRVRTSAFLTALVFAGMLAIPMPASAKNFEVTSVDIGAGVNQDQATCKTAVPAEGCTLRAAIEVANFEPDKDSISFKADVFDGQGTDVIPATGLVPIIQPVTINGDKSGSGCLTTGSVLGPCVEIAGAAGLDVKNAKGVTISGLSITGATDGVKTDNADGLVVRNNWLGVKLTGAKSGDQNGVHTDNKSDDAEIVGNTIWGAENGVHASSDPVGAATGDLIEANVIRDSANAAILIDSGSNLVFGNEIENAGLSGILLAGSADGNQIGGNSPESENIITGSIYSPIRMVLPELTENEVGRNHGSNNGESFIALLRSGSDPNPPNGGTKPPVVENATQSHAEGTAEPGARIRIFRKATEAPGELESFITETQADGGTGKWTVDYPASIPTGTFIGASQTNLQKGTSEFGFGITKANPPGPGGGGGGGQVRPDTSAPNTKIANKPALKGRRTAKFDFTATIAGSSFECKFDKQPFKPCGSPKTYRKLKAGKHVFKVRAVSPAGVADSTPAIKKFKVNP
jgi:parallel beta-helix repeat protein